MSDTRLYWLWLQEALGVGAPQSNVILERFQTAEEVFHADSLSELPELTPAQRKALGEHDLHRARERLRRVQEADAWLLTPEDVAFPALLRGIYATPVVLYGRGSCFCTDAFPIIAVVGTRKATENGRCVTRRLAAGLAAAGAVVVSGGADGLDREALEAAMDAEGLCVSFQACGIDVEYPKFTAPTRRRLTACGGMLLTEFPPGETVHPHSFHVRNRLISGMAHGTFVPQAPLPSGTLITARWAREQGRDVFAAPGELENPLCEGTNALLKDGAKLVTDASDILIEYVARFPHGIDFAAAAQAEEREISRRTQPAAQQPSDKKSAAAPAKKKAHSILHRTVQNVEPEPQNTAFVPCPSDAGEDEQRVYASLGTQPISAAELAAVTALPLPRTLSALTALELSGAVACLAGQRYTRIPQ